MNNRITELEINNFKSIKHIKMDCKRINVLIGKPNVGKSNILEALSLFATPYATHSAKFLKDYVRYEKLSNLFYDNDRKNQVVVKSNLGFTALRFHLNNINQYDLIVGPPDSEILNSMNESNAGTTLDEKSRFFGNLVNSKNINHNSHAIKPYYASVDDISRVNVYYGTNIGYDTPIKKYLFKSLSEHKNHFPSFLSPPFGDNLYTILEGNPSLYEECAGFFNNYGLDLLLDTEDEKIEIQKKIGHRVFKFPYSLAADTLQRIIFHLAAIETNNDSILLLEEPENHSFPPFIKLLAEKIIENETNQFFIATHSPYILKTLIEQCPAVDLSIFVARYEDYETKIKVLNDDEIQNILDTHIDLFFNIRAFEK